jgi:transglutaminase-like putative cysteine protease
VVSHSVVDTPAAGHRPDGLDWVTIGGSTVHDTWCEYLRNSDYVDNAQDDPLRAEVIDRLRSQAAPRLAIDQAMVEIRSRMQYASGTTSVYTTARQAWESGTGVCQDFTHAMLSLLRTVGIPARYVSGYLYPKQGEIGETVTGESHAWVEVWDGGWWACDPTNGTDVGERHIAVARGRDYSDVSPLKGIYSGGESQDLGVEVSLTRLPR